MRTAPNPISPPATSPAVWVWTGRIALAIALVVVIARSTVLEFLRDPFEVVPTTDVIPRGPGPTTSLVMDLLAALPAVLVAARAALDRTFSLRRSRGNAVMLLLAIWIAVSAFRGDDRFAAMVIGANLLATLSLLWATQQLVRDWRSLRLVAGIAFGLLLVCTAHGVIDQLVELPIRQQNLRRNAAEMLEIMRITPGSFEADRIMKKITNGELLGFGASVNTFAAVMVTLLIVSAGAAIQCFSDREEPAAGGAVVAGLAAAALVIYWTDSRTAYATPLLAAGLIGLLAVAGRTLALHRRTVTIAVIAIIAAGIAYLVHHGLKHGTLFHDSLNFRWRYWVGSWGVWLERPAIGVGLDSFQYHYLAHRLPVASEEIKDPHNFLVRAFTEAGAIGGVLVLLWIGRSLWEMSLPARGIPLADAAPTNAPPTHTKIDYRTRAASRDSIPDSESTHDLRNIGFVCAAGIGLSLLATLDWTRLEADAAIEAMKRLLYLCLLAIGAVVVAVRSTQDQRIDDRPAEWIRRTMWVAVIIFLVHNLIDFSMFESSAMFAAALIAGAVWGTAREVKISTEPRAVAIGRMVVAILAWLAAVVMWVAPTAIAESYANEGDAHLRASRPAAAAVSYQRAFEQSPGNADYAFRASRAVAMSPQGNPATAKNLLDAAVAANPFNGKYYVMRAQLEMFSRSPNAANVQADYERALALDPASVSRRLEYADALVKLLYGVEAIRQYELALWYNDQLSPDEPKRLSTRKLTEVRDQIKVFKE